MASTPEPLPLYTRDLLNGHLHLHCSENYRDDSKDKQKRAKKVTEVSHVLSVNMLEVKFAEEVLRIEL